MKRKLISAVAAFLLLSSFALESGYKTGDKAVDFKLKNVDGKMVSLADFKNSKGVVVVFTCNHCPYAKKYEDRIIALDQKYKAKGYPVVAIMPNDVDAVTEDSYDNMQKRAKEKHYGFPFLLDESQATAQAFGATRTPHVFVLQNVNSAFVVKYIGAIDDNSDDAKDVKEKYVENAIDALLAGKPVSPDFTKAIGCTIKWKAKS